MRNLAKKLRTLMGSSWIFLTVHLIALGVGFVQGPGDQTLIQGSPMAVSPLLH